MCLDPSYSVDALKFLQTQLAEVVDHSNEIESAEFRSLTTDLVYRNRGDYVSGVQLLVLLTNIIE